MKQIKLEIDGKTVEAQEGMTVLQVARQADIYIPTLCYHEQLSPYGGCRLCTVEIEKKGKTRLVASCVYPVEEGLSVRTETEAVIKVRKMVLELLLPLSPTGPIETLAKKYGVQKSRFKDEPTGCILCGLCVRYCEEIKGISAVTFVNRGTERDIAFVPEVASETCCVCRECFPLCPSGKIATLCLDGTEFAPLA